MAPLYTVHLVNKCILELEEQSLVLIRVYMKTHVLKMNLRYGVFIAYNEQKLKFV